MGQIVTDSGARVETVRSSDVQSTWGSIKVTLPDGRHATFTWHKGMFADYDARRWSNEVDAHHAAQQWITQASASGAAGAPVVVVAVSKDDDIDPPELLAPNVLKWAQRLVAYTRDLEQRVRELESAARGDDEGYGEPH